MKIKRLHEVSRPALVRAKSRSDALMLELVNDMVILVAEQSLLLSIILKYKIACFNYIHTQIT